MPVLHTSQPQMYMHENSYVSNYTINKNNVQDEASCLIALKWWNKWKNYVNYEDNPFNEFVLSKPTAIDNTILKKQNLVVELDYTVISSDIWIQLHQWYGGGPIKRKRTNKIYQLKLDILNSNNYQNVIERTFNSDTTIGTLRQEICQEMSLNEEKVRIRNCYDNSIYSTQECMNQTLDDVDIMSGYKILFEIQNDNGTWPISNLSSIKTSTITNSIECTSTTISPSTITTPSFSNEDVTDEPNDSKIDNFPQSITNANKAENELEKRLIENEELKKQLNSTKEKIRTLNKQHYSFEQKYTSLEQKCTSLEQKCTSLEQKYLEEKKMLPKL